MLKTYCQSLHQHIGGGVDQLLFLVDPSPPPEKHQARSDTPPNHLSYVGWMAPPNPGLPNIYIYIYYEEQKEGHHLNSTPVHSRSTHRPTLMAWSGLPNLRSAAERCHAGRTAAIVLTMFGLDMDPSRLCSHA